MKKLALLAALLMIGFATVAEPVQAQDASYATWNGTLTPPDHDMVDITYTVRFAARVKQGTVSVPAMDGSGKVKDYTMKEIKVTDSGKMVSYQLTAGDEGQVHFKCKLMGDDKGMYSGDCADQYDNKWGITMDASTANTATWMADEKHEPDTR